MQGRLKQSEIQKLRNQFLQKQKHLCPLCNRGIDPDDAVLDHDHVTGRCRMVLHRMCNAVEGRITNWLRRAKVQDDFLYNVVAYHTINWNKHPLHPTYRTAAEKEISRLRKRLRQVKTDKKKAELKARIKELQNGS